MKRALNELAIDMNGQGFVNDKCHLPGNEDPFIPGNEA
jgi:hypothetical protein